MTACEWCRDPGSDNDEPDTGALCRPHLAEYEGLSVAELDRRDREEATDLL
jgi:hypothetical protein